MTSLTDRLQALLDAGKETALLRTTLGKTALDEDQPVAAQAHLLRATELDPQYSVAWKLLGKAHLTLGDEAAARQAWEHSLAAAQAKGDSQVVKEVGIFLKRLDKQA